MVCKTSKTTAAKSFTSVIRKNFLYLGKEVLWVHSGVHLAVSFGASEATICSKRGSPRSGSQYGNSFKCP
jgi:hypothetical protein